MKKHKNIKLLFILYSLLLVLTLNMQSTFAYVITSAEKITNTFIPGTFPLNDLIVSKEVEHPYGEEYKVPEDLSFDFDIDLSTAYANQTIETSKGKIKADEKGIIRVSLKPGENIHIENFDEGTKVKVTEIQNKEGFTVKDVSVTKDGTISRDETLIVDYTNVYKPVSANGQNITLTGTKILEGREWREGDTFTFNLEYQTDNGDWVILGTKTITYDAENPDFNKFDFTELINLLEFNRLGSHNFRISEVEGDVENIDYDKTINYFNIIVTDETMDGKLEIKEINGFQNIVITNEEDKYNIDVTFNSTFDVTEIKDIDLNITGKKIINNTGKYKIGPENFEFVLENLDTQEKQTIRTDEDGNAIFNITYTKDDIGKVFNYKAYETNEGKEFITYSDKEYKIKVEVILNNKDELEAKITIDNEETKKAELTFENIYHKVDPIGPPKDITVDIIANKKIKNTGDYKIGPENFEFILEDISTTETMLSKSNEKGIATFKMTYTQEDIGKTYTYKLSEKDTKQDYVIYSKDSYIIKVSITLNDKNVLIPTITVNNKEVKKASVEFENIYHKVDYVIPPDDLTLELIIQNTIKNTGDYKLSPENFEFILENVDTKKQSILKTDKNGKASLDLNFTAKDIGKTYHYTLSVKDGKVAGVKYSDKVYDIKITISLNDKNELVATILVDDKVVDKLILEFINTYHKESPVPPTTGFDEDIPKYDIMAMLTLVGILMMWVIKKFNDTKDNYDI